jgi:hypothetical protein
MGYDPKQSKQSPIRGSASTQFPGKLHELVTYCEREGLEDIITWVHDGQAILVHDPERLLKLLPHFGFSQTKYRSFQRQLNMWHWERILEGPFKGGWIHPYFVRGNKSLCSLMSRHETPKNSYSIFPLMAQKTNYVQGLREGLMMVASNNTHTENMEAPVQDLIGTLTAPLEFISTTCKIIEDDWEPLPASNFMDKRFDSFDVQELPVHFLAADDSLFMMEDAETLILEPTPMRESTDGLSQLLEPISPESFDEIFDS